MKLLLEKWDVLKEIKATLHLPYLSTVMLQRENFTLSDFYGFVKIMEMKLNQAISDAQNTHTNLAENMKKCLDERKIRLIETPLMLCAIFLDPRYK